MKTVKYKGEHKQLYVLADTHLEHPNTDLRLIKDHIQLIKNSGKPWVHLGDWVDAIGPHDRRFSIKDQRESVVDSYEKMHDLFEPIAPQCIAALRGNHGTSWSRVQGDMVRIICKRWGVPYLGYTGFVLFFVSNKSYKIFMHHGAGGGRKRGAKTIRLNEWAQFVEADIYLQGHTHTYVQFNDEKILPNNRVKVRHYANATGYIRSYRGHDNYIEELGLNPQSAGCLKISFDPIKIELVT